VDFVYDNAVNVPFVSPAFVVVGFDRDFYQGVPLPPSLAVLGLPGGTLYRSNNLSVYFGVQPGAAGFSWPLPIRGVLVGAGQERCRMARARRA
jgi:hypothetical protein